MTILKVIEYLGGNSSLLVKKISDLSKGRGVDHGRTASRTPLYPDLVWLFM
jgi:hypothetical protein